MYYVIYRHEMSKSSSSHLFNECHCKGQYGYFSSLKMVLKQFKGQNIVVRNIWHLLDWRKSLYLTY